jgi:hypothetical protein
MKIFTLTVLFTAALSTCVFAADDPYSSLRLYNGSWIVTPAGASSPDKLTDDCTLVGKYFTCQQTVNGKTGNLLVFVPDEAKPGLFHMNSVNANGYATGRTELEIAGERWTYLAKNEENGKTTWYRTVNVFSGKDRIHFESSESTDGTNWKTTMSGDEVRAK